MKPLQKISLCFAIVIGILIFYLSSIPYLASPVPAFSGTAGLYHMGIFFLFSLFLLFSGNFKRDFVLVVLFISFVYAGLDELHQYFVPGRVTDLIDFGFDCLGCFFGLIVRAIFWRV